MTQPRITVDEVRAAYAKCGMKPLRGGWITPDGCCCPQVALLLSEFPDSIDWMDFITPAAQQWGSGYAEGFRNGVDGAKNLNCEHDGYRQGFIDGVAVAAAIFGDTP